MMLGVLDRRKKEDAGFHLLHISLVREYLELEFEELKRTIKTFQYDFERIIGMHKTTKTTLTVY